MNGRITRDDLAHMITGAAASIRAQHARLSQLDCAAGDGDRIRDLVSDGTVVLRATDQVFFAKAERCGADIEFDAVCFVSHGQAHATRCLVAVVVDQWRT